MLGLRLVAVVLGIILPSAAFAASWTVRPAESSIAFTATQQGANFTGVFAKFQTEIKFDPADLANSSVVATIDTASFDSKSSDRDAQVKQSEWFDVAKFPTARFATKSFRHISGDKYEATADLTLRDVTKPITLPFTLTIKDNVAHMAGSVKIVRTDYGVGQGEWATSDWVGKDVQVDVKLVADKAP